MRATQMSPRQKKKRNLKRLDAICEKVYNSNRLGGGGVEVENAGAESGELRRSSRVRKAPEFLDASPLPLRKKQRVDGGGGVGSSSKNGRWGDGRKKGLSRDEDEEEEEEEEEEEGWKSRLRSSRGQNVGGNRGSSRRKRMLFDGDDGVREENEGTGGEMGGEKEGVMEEKIQFGKLKRQISGKGKILGSGGLDDEDKEGNDDNLGERLGIPDESENVGLKGSMVDGTDEVVANDGNVELIEKEEGASVDGLRLDEEQSRGVEGLEEKHKRTKQAECEMEGVNHIHGTEEVSHPVDEAKNGGSCVDKAECPAQVGRKQLEDGDVVQRDKLECLSTDRLEKSRVREGRRCGLCGRGNDGRPPKRLGKDSANSDNEAYGGSSSEEANYDTWDGFGDEPGWLGRLQGPIHDRFGIAGVWVHQQCAVWSPEVYFAGLGCLKNVRAALFRGRALKCSRCGRPGATIGCRVDRCPKTYHLPCGRADGCIFDHRKFLIACVDHRHLFQPQGNHYVHRIKKLKAKKLKLEMRKLSHDAWRKDYEAEEKWLENCGEDEEFLKREGKRLHRDILRIAPVYIGGPSSGNEKLGQGWESVAGLEDVVRCMKEVVLLPLLYPEFFSSLGLTPPRGVLLHGYPGTGKTLVVRALIGSCARGDRRIAYFARKGADCLGKYVGDAERQLRLLFQVAEKSQPSIIFFDEIDGLAPCRTRQQDQTHNSVVSTLLALMDGLKSRGSVIVIGATNRPDAVDPALRRPGRFDREIYFPLPSAKDRAAILSVHTQKWPNPVSGTLLKLVAQKTAGFAGADLQALCTQVAMIALKRNCTLQELVSAGGKMAKGGSHLPLSSFHVEEKDWLDALARAPPPCSRREAGMAANEVVSSPLPLHLSPCLLQPLSYLLVSLYRDERVLLPPFLYKAAKMIETAIVSALEQTGKSKDCWWSYLPDLIEKADIAREIERGLSCAGLLIGASNSGISDALNDDDNARNEFELRKVSCTGGSTGLLKSRCYLPDRNPGFRVLITGEPKSGQRHLASCLLHGFAGCVEIQKVDLATISQEGHGDEIEGMTHILYVEASQWSKLPTYNNLLPSLAVKCLSKDLCVVYLPRIDFWAMETQHDNDEKEHEIFENTSTSVDTTGPCDAKRTPSQLWNSFVEQVDSMHSSASLMILATSEAPSEGLPRRITQFFTTDALNFRGSTSSEHTIPRFLVQTDGKFDCNMVINSSTIELSHSLVQQHIQLLHNKTHIAKAQNKAGDVIEGNVEPESHKTSAGSDMLDKMKPRKACNGDASFNDDKTQPHKNAVEQSLLGSTTAGHQEDLTRLCLPQDAGPRILPNNKIVKGKSNLLVAISSFGYQILLYPHFSELCWATSKLKEGPCTDINGPWKGWPFNSCIVRPSNSLERVALGCSSDNLKHKEQSGLVRGLIAVGLLAYRGVYTSVREVAFDVREVLQLLVEQVGAKILCGKDRCRFLRLLSQVAYLEDMVNSWAYTLQSLERDTQMTSLDPGQVIVDHPSENNPVRSDTCKPKTFQRDSDDVQVQQQGLPIFAAEGVAQIDIPNSDATIIDQEEPSQHSLQIPKSPVVPLTSENNLNAKNKESCAEESISDDHISVELHHGSFRPSKQSNGLGEEGCILPSEDGLRVRDELNVVTKSGSRKGSDGSNCLSSDDRACNTDELVGAAKSTVDKNNGVSAVSKTCLYTCCSECLHLVYILIQKILLHEKEASGSCWTVDNVHDVVASWSLNLLSAARELYNVESFNESMIDDGCGKRCACPDVGSSHHESAVNQVVIPLHCRFHLESKSIRESISGLGLDFCFRDNVLISSDVNRDVLLHCKYGNLCLGALIERISMIRQPLD